MDKIIIGCIADDFTGASDAASFMVKGGLKTILFNGIPNSNRIGGSDIQAVVIALKSRTAPIANAVAQSLHAAKWLKANGAHQLYFKYCSTFDSTHQGNIGPVADALMDQYDIRYTILCPSLPINKRTVAGGILFVNGVKLAESPMKDHPLTPMWDSYIPELMREQSKYPCFILNQEVMNLPISDIAKKIAVLGEKHHHFYLVPDYADDQDAEKICEYFGNLPLLTGGSGLLPTLAKKKNYGEEIKQAGKMPVSSGKAIIVAGSCSVATREQVKYFLNHNGSGIMIRPNELLAGKQSVDSLWQKICSLKCESILIYGSGSAEITEEKFGGDQEAKILENTMAMLVQRSVETGYQRIIVAGGETSGAVTKQLNYHAYQIGESIAPGVPVMVPLQNPEIRLVLKSGNFGKKDFFCRALKMTKGDIQSSYEK